MSVVVPVYNREKLVLRCLESILHQIRTPEELIVVDNNSTDCTYSEVRRWMNYHSDSGIHFKLFIEPKKGACAAREKGLKNAQGEYVIFFDSDDEMRPNLLEEATKEIEKDSALDLVCWPCEIEGLDSTMRCPPFDPTEPLENHLIHALLRPQGYMIRKSVIEKAGGWKKDISVWNDYELGLRILLQNPKILGIRKILAHIYSQEESITGKDFSSKEGQWEKTIEEMEVEAATSGHDRKRMIKKILNYRRVILAAHYHREGNQEGAQRLKEVALRNGGVIENILLRFSYHYTRLGLRGVWRLVGGIYKLL